MQVAAANGVVEPTAVNEHEPAASHVAWSAVAAAHPGTGVVVQAAVCSRRPNDATVGEVQLSPVTTSALAIVVDVQLSAMVQASPSAFGVPAT